MCLRWVLVVFILEVGVGHREMGAVGSCPAGCAAYPGRQLITAD